MLLVDAVDLESKDTTKSRSLRAMVNMLLQQRRGIKVTRNSFMKELEGEYPGYGFASNKRRYGTAATMTV